MNTRRVCLLHLAGALSTATLLHAQGSAFTYQGRLNVNGAPASGTYDFRYRLALDPYGNNYFGSSVLAGGQILSNGLFTAALDFGAGAFNGGNYWLEVDVRTNGAGGYTALSPLQPVTPAPYAIFSGASSSAVNATTAATATSATTAATASAVGANGVNGVAIQNNAVTAAKIAAGQVVKSLNGLEDAVTLSGGNNVTITPSGQTLTIAASGGTPGWSLTGNSGTTPGVNFLGTTDNQPLELWVSGSRALRLEPNASSPNVVGGFSGNNVGGAAWGQTVAGGGASGLLNQASGNAATVGGGASNLVQSSTSTISGGYANSIGSASSGASIGGGSGNSMANAMFGTIPGGYGNVVGASYSFAAGKGASAANIGTFVWSDSLGPTASTANNQFMVRCSGGAVFYTAGSPNTGTGVALAGGGGSWSSLSDRDAKDNFVPVDAKGVLEKVAKMPITTWNYRAQGGSTRHMGPMAQDFYAAFGVGEDERHITTVDEDGVALAAIQGLNMKLQEKDAEIQALKGRLEKLERALSSSTGNR